MFADYNKNIEYSSVTKRIARTYGVESS